MKKKIRFLALTLSLLILFGVLSAGSIFAVGENEDYPRIDPPRYMNGYKIYGYCTLNTGVASSSTYCENLSYQKRLNMSWKSLHCTGLYIGSDSIDTGYVTNGFDTLSEASYGSSIWTMIGVMGHHYVKASPHMYWSSYDSGLSTHIGQLSYDPPEV